jgi:hypothetical protein
MLWCLCVVFIVCKSVRQIVDRRVKFYCFYLLLIRSELHPKVLLSSKVFHNPYTRLLEPCPTFPTTSWTWKTFLKRHVIRHALSPAHHPPTHWLQTHEEWKWCELRPSASQFFVRWAVVPLPLREYTRLSVYPTLLWLCILFI